MWAGIELHGFVIGHRITSLPLLRYVVRSDKMVVWNVNKFLVFCVEAVHTNYTTVLVEFWLRK